MKDYRLSDLFFKIRYKVWDYMLWAKWKCLLGSMGGKSFIRSGVRIIGNPRRISIGNGFKIYQNTIISIGKGRITIGNTGLIGVGTYLNCGDENLIIGNNVAIAPYCRIFTHSHHYLEGQLTIASYRNGDVVIGDNVLIGTNTTILPGVKIGNGAVIGAGSLVNKDIEPNSIVAGTPAKTLN
jgi:acetyltransferase-like isoleucine patch superfamily enzyme